MLRRLFGRSRTVLALVTLLLVAAALLPLWQTRMEAPQYKGEEALWVRVYASRVSGDLKEIDTLNQYVGVRLPLTGAEMQLVPWVFAGLVLAALATTVLPSRHHRRAGIGLFLALVIVGGASIGVLQYRLWQMGHDRGEQIFEGVDDFTPPALGKIHIANFDARMSLGTGGWAMLLAAVLCSGLGWLGPDAGDGPSAALREETAGGRALERVS